MEAPQLPIGEKAIQNFQNNDECRVFPDLAGKREVGLNTAADYVYIVDPLEPAVEQQAIDRTHRMSQTKNIFAYRMICINTIEIKYCSCRNGRKTGQRTDNRRCKFCKGPQQAGCGIPLQLIKKSLPESYSRQIGGVATDLRYNYEAIKSFRRFEKSLFSSTETGFLKACS